MTMLLPSGAIVTARTPIYPESNFTWGEVTKNCTRRIESLIIDGKTIISAINIEKNIVSTARELDQYRTLFGNRPILVNSWYRPKNINARVGGSKYSRHQFGDAVDIRSDYLSAFALYRKLDRLHTIGGLGKYISFVHIDFRGELARWRG